MSNHDFTPEEQAERLEKEFIRPLDTFKGVELWPYTRAMQLLFAQVSTDEDTLLFRSLAFVFMHRKRTESTQQADVTKHVVSLAWDINAFRSKVAFFFDDLTEQDVVEAIRIYESTMEREMQSRVKAGSALGQKPQKKTETTPATRRGRGTSSGKNSASRRRK